MFLSAFSSGKSSIVSISVALVTSISDSLLLANAELIDEDEDSVTVLLSALSWSLHYFSASGTLEMC